MLTGLRDDQRVHRLAVAGLERAMPPDDISVRRQGHVTARGVPIGVQLAGGGAWRRDVQHLDQRGRARGRDLRVSVRELKTSHVTDRHRHVDGLLKHTHAHIFNSRLFLSHSHSDTGVYQGCQNV